MLMYGVFNDPLLAIKGRLLSGGYMPFTISDQLVYGTRQRLVPIFNSHPLLAGVQQFDGGFQSFRINVTLATNATLVAVWNNASVPLVAVKRRVVGYEEIVKLKIQTFLNASTK